MGAILEWFGILDVVLASFCFKVLTFLAQNNPILRLTFILLNYTGFSGLKIVFLWDTIRKIEWAESTFLFNLPPTRRIPRQTKYAAFWLAEWTTSAQFSATFPQVTQAPG